MLRQQVSLFSFLWSRCHWIISDNLKTLALVMRITIYSWLSRSGDHWRKKSVVTMPLKFFPNQFSTDGREVSFWRPLSILTYDPFNMIRYRNRATTRDPWVFFMWTAKTNQLGRLSDWEMSSLDAHASLSRHDTYAGWWTIRACGFVQRHKKKLIRCYHDNDLR